MPVCMLDLCSGTLKMRQSEAVLQQLSNLNVKMCLPYVCRYRLDADSPAAMRDFGQKDRRRQLEKAVSQGNKAVVKVSIFFRT